MAPCHGPIQGVRKAKTSVYRAAHHGGDKQGTAAYPNLFERKIHEQVLGIIAD